MSENNADRLFALLEDASQRVKEWPEWKRSEDSKRELERLAQERKESGSDDSE